MRRRRSYRVSRRRIGRRTFARRRGRVGRRRLRIGFRM